MKISIITVVFNNKKFVANCIESVLAQTYPDIEYIIVDGKSTDGTIEILKKYEGKITKIISEPDNGIYDAMNKGIMLSTGKIIGTLNADDFFCDYQVINDVVQAFNTNDIDCLYGNLVYVNRNNTDKITRTWRSCEYQSGLFEKSWTPAHPTFYCKRELFEKFGKYRLDFKIASDAELMYRFLEKHKVRSLYLPRTMVIMRNAGVSNNGLQSTLTIVKEMKKAITENGGDFNLFKYLFFKGLKISQIIKK